MIPRFAVIATRNRPDDLARCVESIAHQCNGIVVINNNTALEAVDDVMATWPDLVMSCHIPTQPPNLSRLWNTGLDIIVDMAELDGEGYDVAILNDDAIVPPGWFQAMSDAMREHGAAAACQQPFGSQLTQVWGPDVAPSVATRLTGWAFLLRGELGLRFDEQFEWWGGDDDMSIQARRSGGLVMVPGFPVQNVHANESTVGVLLEQSAVDMQRFVDKHGVRPW